MESQQQQQGVDMLQMTVGTHGGRVISRGVFEVCAVQHLIICCLGWLDVCSQQQQSVGMGAWGVACPWDQHSLGTTTAVDVARVTLTQMSLRNADCAAVSAVQEPMYMPLGLACGHKACLECALEAAGLQKMKGTLRAVLLNAPRHAQCFQCRQPGMFNKAVLLKQLGAAIERK